jgi:lantibiotic biosynthesis protein
MRPDEGAWVPLLRGAEAQEALAAARAIAEVLRPERRWVAEPEAQNDGPVPGWHGAGGSTLAYGCLGWSLFYAYFNEVQPASGFGDLAEEWYDLALAEPTVGHSILTGCAGTGWTTRYLDGRVFELAGGDDSYDEMDQSFLTMIGEADERTDWAYEKGLLSCGAYFAARLPAAAACQGISALVDYFDRIAHRDAAGVAWLLHPDSFRYVNDVARFPDGVYSLTTAHGMPGVLSLLASAVAAEINAHKARALLQDAVRWIAAQELPPDRPVALPEVVVGTAAVEVHGRLSWCRGDLGVATVLCGVANRLEEEQLAEFPSRLARRVLRRRGAPANIEGPELCHGAAGAAHLANRIFQATRDEAAGQAARYWIRQTLNMRRSEFSDTAGFWAWLQRSLPDGPFARQPHRSFIVGAAGVGLALLAAVADVEPAWDRILLL